MGEAISPEDCIESSIAALRAYRRGECDAFISSVERGEQGLPAGLNLTEQVLVRQLLALPDDEETQTAAIRSAGSERAYGLLKTVLAHPRRPHPRLVLEPYIERRADDVTWLLERVEVGITGVTIRVRLWTRWPREAWLEPGGPQPAAMHLRWKGFHPLSDDTGRSIRFAAGGIGQAVTEVKTDDWTGQRYCVIHDEWWRPGVALQARALSLHTDLQIEVDRWVGGDRGSWSPHVISLGSFNCTLYFPKRWSGGEFTPLGDE